LEIATHERYPVGRLASEPPQASEIVVRWGPRAGAHAGGLRVILGHVPTCSAVLLRRLVVVSVADAEPGPSTLFASRFLDWLVAERRVRTLVVLGSGGELRERLVGHGTVIAADDLDDFWAARLWSHLPSRRGHRQLRWLRAAWWRIRLRLSPARLVPVAGPLPGPVARCLPRWMQERADHPEVPGTLAPHPSGEPAPPSASVVGFGSLGGEDGIDLWLRAVHELAPADLEGGAVWFRTGVEDEPTEPVAHECWHLGLDDLVAGRPVDAGSTSFELADAGVLVACARPGHDPLGEVEAAVPGAAWLLRTGQVPVVHFVGHGLAAAQVSPLPADVQATAVVYPDVVALAAAVRTAASPNRVQVEQRLDALLGDAGRR
jgi:hypothetical protein